MESPLARVVEQNSTDKKSLYKHEIKGQVHEFDHGHSGGSAALPAEAAYMDLNPNISMFRRMANNSIGGDKSSKDHNPQYAQEFSSAPSKELTDDSIEFHYRNDHSQLKPA